MPQIKLDLSKKEKGPRRFIIRFVNRKFCESFLRSSKKLRNDAVYTKAGLSQKVFVNNNLCGYNKLLWGKAKAFKNIDLIHKFWCFNGTINVQINENDPAIKIKHINDLSECFPENDLCVPGLSASRPCLYAGVQGSPR